MDNDENQPNNLNEAPASASTKIKSPNGFEWIFTVRDEKASVLSFKMKAMEENWLKYGFSPVIQGFGKKVEKAKEFVEGEGCELCGARLVAGTTKTGKQYYKCEKQSYNFQTRQAEGCSFIRWL